MQQMVAFLMKYSSDVYWRLDKDLNVTYMSTNVQKLVGISLREAFEESLEDKFSEESYSQIMEAINEGLNTTKPGEELVVTLQTKMKCYNEVRMIYYKDVSILCHGVLDKNGELDFIEGILRDNSEHVEYLQNIERMRCFGGVCHSLAQPMQAIIGAVDIIKEFHKQDDVDLNRLIDSLSTAADRAATILLNLQKLQRGEPYKIIPYANTEVIDCG